jgi:hypothetical protein
MVVVDGKVFAVPAGFFVFGGLGGLGPGPGAGGFTVPAAIRSAACLAKYEEYIVGVASFSAACLA